MGQAPLAHPAPRKINWLLFLLALLAPPLLTVLAAMGSARNSGLPVATGLLAGGLGGIISGAMLGWRVGSTTPIRVALGIVFAGVLSVVCIGMSCFGCMAGGFKMDFR